MNRSTRKSSLFVLLFSFIVCGTAQFFINPVTSNKFPPPNTDPYKKYWAKVDSLQNLGLTESANKVVNEIYVVADKNQHTLQLIKCFFHLSKYRDILEEESFKTNVVKLDELIAKSSSPYTELLYSIKGEVLWNRYQSNLWQINQRTPLAEDKEADIEFWDAKRFANESMKCYERSLKNESLLMQTQLNGYVDILAGDSNFRKLKPTLYDFLMHRAIRFYQNNYLDMLEPAEKFEINKEDFYALGDRYMNILFDARDSASSLQKAMKLYQQLYKFHKKGHDLGPWIQLEIERLDFISRKSVLENNDQLYLDALKRLINTHKTNEAVADVYYVLAQTYFTQSSNWTPGSDEKFYREYRREALKTCDEANQLFPGSDGAHNCRLYKKTILAESISVNIKQANNLGANILAQISYRNIDQIFVRIYRHNYDQIIDKITHYDTQTQGYKAARSGELVKEYHYSLRAFDDYFNHTTEIAIDPLSAGFYTFTFSSQQDDSKEESFNGFTSFWSTNIGVLELTSYNGAGQLFNIVDRSSGNAIANASVGVYRLKYNYSTYEYDREKIKSGLTDKYGMIRETFNNNQSYFLDIRSGTDRFVTQQFYAYNYPDYVQKEEVRFFLDRGMFRPGQTVNFKLIATRNDKKSFSVIPKRSLKVAIQDINMRVISELDVVTNDFGTASGSFILPASVATGTWRITCKDGIGYFQVEEYKRPKFEVKIDSIPGSCDLNDVVTVRGSAKALAGFGITDADVTYKVDRTTQMFIYDYNYYNRNSGVKTISTGKLKTNEKGEFEFSFIALPDLKVKPRYEPYFTYNVTVDVTDLSGETRSAGFSVMVGYKSMNIGSGVPYNLSKSDTNTYEFFASNLSGFKVNTKGTYEIRKVIVPAHYMVDRPFPAPDEPLMNEDEFRKIFPDYPYTNENDVKKWKQGELVLTGSFDTEKQTALTKNTWKTLDPAWYVITTKAPDSKGREVKGESYFMLYDAKEKSYPFQQFFTCLPQKTYCKKGEMAELLLGSSADRSVVYLIHEFDGKLMKVETVNLNKEQKLVSFPSFADKTTPHVVHIYVVNNNHVNTSTQYIYLDDDSDKLEFELVTFRDKLLPGQEEEWKLKLKGNVGQGIAGAEILANMYDASLDLISSYNNWNYYYYNYNYTYYYWGQSSFNGHSNGYGVTLRKSTYETYKLKTFESLNYFGWNMGYNYGYYNDYRYYDGFYGGLDDMEEKTNIRQNKNNEVVTLSTTRDKDIVAAEETVAFGNGLNNKPASIATGSLDGNMGGGEKSKLDNGLYIPPADNKPRTNFNETAFFFPHLITNDKGEVTVSFKVPESLTKWKFRAMANTADMRTTYVDRSVVTQKEIMITAFAPRFVREGDKIYFSAKVTNLTDKDVSATAKLDIKDAIQTNSIDLIADDKKEITVQVEANQSARVSWYVEIPRELQAITYTLTAKSGVHTDGEENTIPVMSNRMLVTEAVPMYVRGDSTKSFQFTNLLASTNSGSLTHERLTLEVTSNPAWYAIQALPYMMEYPYECAEQTFNRYYANAIGAHIANSDPRIKKVFEIWKNYQPNALLSNLEKNQELKNILIEETPWLRDAKDETERKRRVGILFDLSRMNNEADATLSKLAKLQVSNGAWPWFDGGPDNRYITQYIVCGMGHLKKLGVDADNPKLKSMVVPAVAYLDNQIKRDYDYLIKWGIDLDLDNISYYQIQYLYARSFFKEIPVKEKDKVAYDYYYGQAEKYWLNKGIYMQGMIALAHFRGGNTNFASNVIRSIKENAVKSDEMGMYWKQLAGWYWYEAPIETQSLLIEAFDEVTNDQVAVEEMKIWLLKNKQTNDWKTTKATADACYVLILKGTNLLADEPQVDISLGNTVISSTDPKIVKEAGTGYFKYTFDKSAIKPEMGNLKMMKKGKGISWGAVYWQYFEDLDKIPASLNNLQVNKRLFRKVYTKTGNTLEPVTSTSPLKIGDRLTIRLELKTDRDMEFVHIKDMRASSLEPENVISMYKYREGLSYYQSTRDVATHFFVEFMPKGSYVFEYNVRVTHAGEFSNGITTIQCMYAPEFTSHTKGMNIKTVD